MAMFHSFSGEALLLPIIVEFAGIMR